jgi:type II secretory pathway component PulF
MTVAFVGAAVVGVIGVSWRIAVASMVVAAVVVTMPGLAVGFAAAWAAYMLRARLRRARCRQYQKKVELASLCDLTAIALTGGLGLHSALELAIDHVGGEVGVELERLLRHGRVDGIGPVMASADGAGRRLYRIVGRAAGSGSALAESIARLADDLQSELAAGQLETVRRLPVTMLFPLTMLILPGFLLLAIAPAVLDSVGRLQQSAS